MVTRGHRSYRSIFHVIPIGWHCDQIFPPSVEARRGRIPARPSTFFLYFIVLPKPRVFRYLFVIAVKLYVIVVWIVNANRNEWTNGAARSYPPLSDIKVTPVRPQTDVRKSSDQEQAKIGAFLVREQKICLLLIFDFSTNFYFFFFFAHTINMRNVNIQCKINKVKISKGREPAFSLRLATANPSILYVKRYYGWYFAFAAAFNVVRTSDYSAGSDTSFTRKQ